jgi:DNA polymerase-1
MANQTILIDGDVLVYKIGCAVSDSWKQEETHSDESEVFITRTVEWGNKQEADQALQDEVDRICKSTQSTEVIIALSDAENNFRKGILPSYKGGRAKKLKPVLYSYIRQYIHNNFKTYERPGLEGDDILGILATSKQIKGNKAIYSIDKDFKTIPCTFFRAGFNGEADKIVVSEKEADYYFLYQTLMGDSVDGYSGCPGIGDKKAKKVLGELEVFNLEEGWKRVVEAYEKAELSEEDALIQARMARILRAEDYDFGKKEVKLWKPMS